MPTAKKQKKKINSPRGEINLKKEILFLCSCCAVITLVLLTGFNFNTYLAKRKVLGVTNTPPPEAILTEKAFWEEKVASHPTYLDGWLELARIYARLGNWPDSQRALLTAQRIDPNSIRLQVLAQELLEPAPLSPPQ